jgi:hypothetical protein
MPHQLQLDRLIADDYIGAWSEGEETCLHQVMQAMEEQGKTPDNTTKFWKVVSERMDKSRTRDQCRDKW